MRRPEPQGSGLTPRTVGKARGGGGRPFSGREVRPSGACGVHSWKCIAVAMEPRPLLEPGSEEGERGGHRVGRRAGGPWDKPEAVAQLGEREGLCHSVTPTMAVVQMVQSKKIPSHHLLGKPSTTSGVTPPNPTELQGLGGGRAGAHCPLGFGRGSHSSRPADGPGQELKASPHRTGGGRGEPDPNPCPWPCRVAVHTPGDCARWKIPPRGGHVLMDRGPGSQQPERPRGGGGEGERELRFPLVGRGTVPCWSPG